MSHNRSARNKIDGTFTVNVYDWHNNLFATKTFTDMREADEWANSQERIVMLTAQDENALCELPEMTDDEILAELLK